MGLVDDQGVVGPQFPVVVQLGQEHAVGHHLEHRPLAHPVGEADLVPHRRPERYVEFFSDPFGDTASGDAAGLGVADHALDAPAGR